MPDLTYPGVYPFNDDTRISASDVYSCIWTEVAADLDTAWSVVNALDHDNFATTFKVGPEYTQRRCHVFGQGASGTANLDYKGLRYGMFSGYSESNENFSMPDDLPFYPIPGGCTSLYVPWTARALVMWQVFWSNAWYHAGDDQTQRTRLFLTVDGVLASEQTRAVNRFGTVTAPATGRFREFTPYAYQKARYWAGHAAVALARGWHDIGLNIVQTNDVILGRVHAVSIKVVPFKYGSAT